MALPPLRLNPALDAAKLAAIYARGSFVQVRDMFEPEIARAIGQMLRETVRWDLVYADAEAGVVRLSQAQMQELGQEEMRLRMQRVMELASRNYGFCYSTYQMREAVISGRDPDHPIHDLTRFLRGPEVRAFMGQVIGGAAVHDMDAQATLYARGNFLTRHIDDGMRGERLAAYTIGFTEGWQTDWGGLLLLLNKETTDVTSGWLPRFNTLTVFDGRIVHSVSAVSAFAPEGRYSIAGWLLKEMPV